VFDPILTTKRRGFAGRPLAALVFGVAAAVVASYASSRMNLRDPVLSVMVLGLIAVVAGVWHWLDG